MQPEASARAAAPDSLYLTIQSTAFPFLFLHVHINYSSQPAAHVEPALLHKTSFTAAIADKAHV